MFKKINELLKKFLFKSEVEELVYYINGSDTLPPPLSKDEEAELFVAYNNGSLEARNKLIEHNLRLVVYVAKRYEVNTTNLEDLISIGCLGLIKAISTFKADIVMEMNYYFQIF